MWKDVFEIVFFIEPATGLLIIDLILPSLLSALFYGISYKFVGTMYGEGLISTATMGSFFHWFVRLGLVYAVIWAFNLILGNLLAFIPAFMVIGLFIYYNRLK